MNSVKRVVPWIAGLFCFGLAWQWTRMPAEGREGVRVTLSVTTSMSGQYQLFYDTVGQGFAPPCVATATVHPGLAAQEVRFELPALPRIHGLRLDPGDHRTSILLHHLRLDGPFRSIQWNAQDVATHFTILHDLDSLRTIPHESSLVLRCTGTDPFLASSTDLAPLLREALDPLRPVMMPFLWAVFIALVSGLLVRSILRIRIPDLRWRPRRVPMFGALMSLLAALAIFYFARSLLDHIRFEEHTSSVAIAGSFPENDDVQVFHAEKANGFTRDALVQFPIAGNTYPQLASFALPPRTDPRYLRFDPGMFQDTLWLDSLLLCVGSEHLTWDADSLLHRFVPNDHVASMDTINGRLRIITRGNDPFFTVDEDLSPVFAAMRHRSGNGPLPTLIAFILAVFFLLGSARAFSSWIERPDMPARDKVLIIAFVSIVVAPLLTATTGTEPVLKNTEKRALAERPVYELERTLAYPTEFTTYYEENFGLRKLFFRWNSFFISKALNTSPLPERNIFGKDGWMFYMREDAIPRYEGICTLTEAQLIAITDRLEVRRRWLAAQGIEYVLMIPPEKSAIYPDKLPSRIQRLNEPSCLDQFISLLTERTQVPMVDVRRELKDARAFGDVYYTTDTHWNPVGAWYGYAALINAIRERTPDVSPPVPFQRYDMHVDTNDQGDLSTLIGLNDVYTRVTPLLVPHDSLRAEEAQPGSYASSGFLKYPPVVKEVQGSKAPRLLMFRDSFGVYMIPSLSEHFSRSAYVWTPVFIPQIVAEERPDIVVHEVMEFYLSDLLQDDLPLPPLPTAP
ncbi:MAG: hypothetical protein JNM62_13410 [Flavobacteriales bacterium]|nr:hypothetical protein [Flavobacteriales bacterium]